MSTAKFYSLSEIKTIHLEVTTKCNAACPMCMRNISGGKVNPKLPLAELSLADVEQIFNPTLIAGLKRIMLCGNYGDPIVAKDTLAIIKYFRSHSAQMAIDMHTNGSAHTESWWEELAHQRVKVIFGIDGLADTHHLYRRHTQFERILKNARAFIRAGGRAHWVYLVFRHNEHQVEEARRLSEEVGFQSFQVKKSGRFFDNTRLKGKEVRAVLSAEGAELYQIEPPQNPAYRNQSLQKERQIDAHYGTLSHFLESSEIQCKVLQDKSLYIDAQGHVYPCCWTGNVYTWYEQNEILQRLEREWGGLDVISAKRRTLAEILDGPFFYQVAESWQKKSFADGRLKVCARTCGQGFDKFGDQFK